MSWRNKSYIPLPAPALEKRRKQLEEQFPPEVVPVPESTILVQDGLPVTERVLPDSIVARLSEEGKALYRRRLALEAQERPFGPGPGQDTCEPSVDPEASEGPQGDAIVCEHPAITKKCRGCGESKRLSEFLKEPKGKYGRKSRCRSCTNQRKRENRAQEREWSRAGKARQFQDLKKDTLRYRAKKAASHANERAKAYGLPGRITADDVLLLWEHDQYACLSCGGDYGLDHVVALRDGGANDIRNCQTLCSACNNRKQRKPLDYRRDVAEQRIA